MSVRTPLGTRVRVVQGIWVAGFSIGTATHLADLLLGGVDVYAGNPLALRLFWVSLTVVDPLVVVLLWRHRRAGVALGAAVMVIDVVVNWSVVAGGWQSAGQSSLGLFAPVCQAVFGVVVLATVSTLWRGFHGTGSTEPSPSTMS